MGVDAVLCRSAGLTVGSNISSQRVFICVGVPMNCLEGAFVPQKTSLKMSCYSRPCRKHAVPSGTTCAKVRLFNTSHLCSRAGLIQGKSLKKMVSAVGIEPTTY